MTETKKKELYDAVGVAYHAMFEPNIKPSKYHNLFYQLFSCAHRDVKIHTKTIHRDVNIHTKAIQLLDEIYTIIDDGIKGEEDVQKFRKCIATYETFKADEVLPMEIAEVTLNLASRTALTASRDRVCWTGAHLEPRSLFVRWHEDRSG